MNRAIVQGQRVGMVSISEVDEWVMHAQMTRWGGYREFGGASGYGFARAKR